MYRISVMYPNQDGARFDIEYYRTKHMELVRNHLKPFGLIKTEVDRGISGVTVPSPPYICIGHLYFESKEGFDKGMSEAGPLFRNDIPNYTNVAPVRQVSEILD